MQNTNIKTPDISLLKLFLGDTFILEVGKYINATFQTLRLINIPQPKVFTIKDYYIALLSSLSLGVFQYYFNSEEKEMFESVVLRCILPAFIGIELVRREPQIASLSSTVISFKNYAEIHQIEHAAKLILTYATESTSKKFQTYLTMLELCGIKLTPEEISIQKIDAMIKERTSPQKHQDNLEVIILKCLNAYIDGFTVNGMQEHINLIIRLNIDINKIHDENGNTILHNLCLFKQQKRKSVIKHLIEHPNPAIAFNFKAKNYKGHTMRDCYLLNSSLKEPGTNLLLIENGALDWSKKNTNIFSSLKSSIASIFTLLFLQNYISIPINITWLVGLFFISQLSLLQLRPTSTQVECNQIELPDNLLLFTQYNHDSVNLSMLSSPTLIFKNTFLECLSDNTRFTYSSRPYLEIPSTHEDVNILLKELDQKKIESNNLTRLQHVVKNALINMQYNTRFGMSVSFTNSDLFYKLQNLNTILNDIIQKSNAQYEIS